MEVKDWSAAGKERFTTPGGPPRPPAEEGRTFSYTRDAAEAVPSLLRPQPRAEVSPFSREAEAAAPEPKPQVAPKAGEGNFWKKALRWLLPLLAGAFLAGLLLGTLLYPLLYEKRDPAAAAAPETTAAGSEAETAPHPTAVPETTAAGSEAETGPHPTDPRNGDAAEGSLAVRIFQENADAVVGVTASDQTNPWNSSAQTVRTGVGVLISEDGYLLTDAGLVLDATELTVTLRDGRQLPARLLDEEEGRQSGPLALLKIGGEGLSAAALGDADALETGDWLCLLDAPEAENGSITVSRVASMDTLAFSTEESVGFSIPQMTIDLPLTEDRLGAPLFDRQGRLVGIVSSFSLSFSAGDSDSFSVVIHGFAEADDSAESGTVIGSSITLSAEVRVQPLSAEITAALLDRMAQDRAFWSGFVYGAVEDGMTVIID